MLSGLPRSHGHSPRSRRSSRSDRGRRRATSASPAPLWTARQAGEDDQECAADPAPHARAWICSSRPGRRLRCGRQVSTPILTGPAMDHQSSSNSLGSAALQLWTIRDAMAADADRALGRVKAAGFSAVELAPLPPGLTPERLADCLARHGLAVVSIHGDLPTPANIDHWGDRPRVPVLEDHLARLAARPAIRLPRRGAGPGLGL